MGRRYRLTQEVEDRIAGYVSQGGFEHVAAAAAGVPRHVFNEWMRRGKRGRRGRYRRFYERVCVARAAARLKAEIDVHGDAKFWLSHGPGKERPGWPGWSATPKAAAPKLRRKGQAAEAGWNPWWSVVLEALTPYPEARQALVAALEKFAGRGEETP